MTATDPVAPAPVASASVAPVATTPAAPARPAPGPAPAAGRKPKLRGWLHLIWFEISLVVGTLLVTHAHGTARITSLAVYAASVSALFGASALYHRGNWCAAWHRRLHRLDQAMIFFLIAGTATPAFLLAVPGPMGRACLIALWALTLAAVGIRMAWLRAPERLGGALFLGLGWMAGLSLPWVWAHAGPAPGALMIAGGLLYTAGAVSYHRRWGNLSPGVFGFHEVFHVYVCAAATCQYIGIVLLAR